MRPFIGRNSRLDVDFTGLALGSMSAASFLSATGMTYTCSTANVTVQTDANTVVSAVPADYACVGCLSSVQAERGLVIQPTTKQGMNSSSQPRDHRTSAGWSSGTATTTNGSTGGPSVDGATNVNRVAVTSGQFSNYISSSTAEPTNTSAWCKLASGTNTGQLKYDNGAANTGRAVPLTGISLSVWKRFDLTKANGTAGGFIGTNDGRDFSSVGGNSAQASDIYIDLLQYEYKQEYCTEAMPLGNTVYSNRRLSYSSGSSLISAGQLRLDVQLQPMFDSSTGAKHFDIDAAGWTAANAWYLASWGTSGQNFIRINTAGKVEVKIANGTTYTSTNVMTFSRYDRVQIQTFVGSSVTSVCRYRIWSVIGGAWGSWTDLVLATVPDVPAPSGAVSFLMNGPTSGTGDTGQPPCRVQRLTCW